MGPLEPDGLIVKRIGTGARASTTMIERCTWFAALGDLFGLTFEASAPGTTDRLWERTLAHTEHGRPPRRDD